MFSALVCRACSYHQPSVQVAKRLSLGDVECDVVLVVFLNVGGFGNMSHCCRESKFLIGKNLSKGPEIGGQFFFFLGTYTFLLASDPPPPGVGKNRH